MKKILLILLLLSLPVISAAKVYTNADLKPEPPSKSPSPPVSQPQQQSPDSHGSASSSNKEQREPASKPPSNVDAYSGANDKLLFRSKPNTALAETLFDRILDKAFTNITVFMLIIYAVPFLIGLICLIDILRSRFTRHNKLIWFLVILFVPLIGPILYFLIGTHHKVKPMVKEERIERLI